MKLIQIPKLILKYITEKQAAAAIRKVDRQMIRLIERRRKEIRHAKR